MSNYPENKHNGDPIQFKIDEIENNANRFVTPRYRESFMRRLFPNRLQRENVNHELRQAKTEFDFREKALQIAREAQLQTIQEMFNDYLVKGKTCIRRERAEFVLEQKIMLEKTLYHATDEFNKNIMDAYERVEKIDIPELKEKNQEMIFDAIDRYNSLVTQLQEQFQSILSEGVKA